MSKPAPVVERARAYGYTVGRCVYCGRPVAGVVCAAHADIVKHDPLMLAAGRGTVQRDEPSVSVRASLLPAPVESAAAETTARRRLASDHRAAR